VAGELTNIDQFPDIKAFVKETGFKCWAGEIGFGRPCVGIYNPLTECYVAYQVYNEEDYSIDAEHTVAVAQKPNCAYHKGPYLAILVEDLSEKFIDMALQRLNKWIRTVRRAGYKIACYQERNSITALAAGGMVVQKAIVNVDWIDRVNARTIAHTDAQLKKGGRRGLV